MQHWTPIGLGLLLAAFAGCGGPQVEGTMTAADVDRMAAFSEAGTRDEWQRPDDVVALLEIEHGMTVVDLGAGTGYMLPHLSRAVGPNGRVVAVEVEPLLADRLRELVQREHLTNVDVHLTARDNPTLDGGGADRILVLDTWAYVENRRRYAGYLERALKPEGFVLVVEVNEDAPHGPPEGQRQLAHHAVDELHSGRFHAEVIEDEELPHQWVVRGRPQR